MESGAVPKLILTLIVSCRPRKTMDAATFAVFTLYVQRSFKCIAYWSSNRARCRLSLAGVSKDKRGPKDSCDVVEQFIGTDSGSLERHRSRLKTTLDKKGALPKSDW